MLPESWRSISDSIGTLDVLPCSPPNTPFTLEVTRLSYRTAHKDWSQVIQLCSELEGFRLHDLRHTFATERVGLMGIEELRALMGHTNIQTTLRYQKVTSSRAEEVAKKALESLTKS